MGTEISGWIEVFSHDWVGVVQIDVLLIGNYDMYGSLFGVKNYAGFRPIASNRGLPDDVSGEVKTDEMMPVSHSHTWLTHSEIEAIDWDEKAEAVDQRITYYRLNENDEWIRDHKGLPANPLLIDTSVEGKTQVGKTLYEVGRMVRKDAWDERWELVFSIMSRLAETFGSDAVRLVVYFYS